VASGEFHSQREPLCAYVLWDYNLILHAIKRPAKKVREITSSLLFQDDFVAGMCASSTTALQNEAACCRLVTGGNVAARVQKGDRHSKGELNVNDRQSVTHIRTMQVARLVGQTNRSATSLTRYGRRDKERLIMG